MNQSNPATDLSLAASARRNFLRRTAMYSAAGASAALLSRTAFGQNQEAVSAITNPALPSPDSQSGNFISIRKHENDHVAALVAALGANARPKPTFQYITEIHYSGFVYFSQVLENTGVAAYLGAAPYIENPDYLAAAGSIALIEARHAGYLNVLRGQPITGNALDTSTDNSFETPFTAAQVVAAVSPLIASLNGGSVPGYSTTPSEQNDIDILNFALALEYLEAEFYNINVPKFFSTES